MSLTGHILDEIACGRPSWQKVTKKLDISHEKGQKILRSPGAVIGLNFDQFQ
jgi:hypothetical protein